MSLNLQALESILSDLVHEKKSLDDRSGKLNEAILGVSTALQVVADHPTSLHFSGPAVTQTPPPSLVRKSSRPKPKRTFNLSAKGRAAIVRQNHALWQPCPLDRPCKTKDKKTREWRTARHRAFGKGKHEHFTPRLVRRKAA